MLKIKGLDKLQRDVKEAQRALKDIDGEMGSVHFDPNDPASIEAAIQKVNQMVDQRTALYSSNPFIKPFIEQMKEAHRNSILDKATEARLKSNEEK